MAGCLLCHSKCRARGTREKWVINQEEDETEDMIHMKMRKARRQMGTPDAREKESPGREGRMGRRPTRQVKVKSQR